MRLLLVEDDPHLGRFIQKGLQEERYAVDLATDGEEGLCLATVNQYDLIILDIMLPKLDGFGVCRKLRADRKITPILMLTAREAVEDRVAGLDTGADDYLTKPFAFTELLARVRALLRRGRGAPAWAVRATAVESGSRIRLSALLLIGALLVAFSVLVYSGLSVILHRYLDARLLAFGVNWAEFIEETNEALPDSVHQPALSEPRGTDSEENRELREVARSLLILAPDGTVVWKGAAAQTRPSLPGDLWTKALRGEIVYDTIKMASAPPVRRISVPVLRNGTGRYILQAETP